MILHSFTVVAESCQIPNVDWLLWLKYISNLILYISLKEKNPKLLSHVMMEAIMKHRDALLIYLNILHLDNFDHSKDDN